MLVGRFLQLCHYARKSIGHSLDTESTKPEEAFAPSETGQKALPLQSVDLLLPKVCEALVLVIQCLCTVLLAAETTSSAPILTNPAEPNDLKGLIAASKSSQGSGMIESLIGKFSSPHEIAA